MYILERDKRHSVLYRMSTSDSEESVALMANDTIEVEIQERHKTYMQSCCSEGNCFANFKDLEDRLLDIEPEPVFNYLHKNDHGIYVTSTPLTKKWFEFVFDMWNWCTHQLFEENYVTQLDVNTAGRGKIYAAWRIMDQYRGRYRAKNLTRNVVDIKITIPEFNIVFYEHFCFKYFRRSRGSPYTLVPDKIRIALARMYDKYYEDRTLATASVRVHFTCACCSHDEDEGPESRHIKLIPKWYLRDLYTTTNRVSLFDHLLCNFSRISCCFIMQFRHL